MSDRLVTIPNVTIAHTGTYKLSTGERTFTREHFAAAVAAQDDPGLNPPRLDAGHVDPRFNSEWLAPALASSGLDQPTIDSVIANMAGWYDGNPALGVVTNLRLTNDGHTIVGDYQGVPAWLDDGVLASAFPSRSLEGRFNVKSSTGRVHAFVIDAVALLGTVLPGISTIDDIKQRYVDAPDGVLPPEENLMAKAAVRASVGVDEVREAYYDTLPNGSWAWVREVRLAPDSLIVDDGNGDLTLVPFTVDSADQITFSDGTEVRVQYVAEDDSEQVAASAGTVAAKVYATRAESRPDSQEDQMDPKVLEALGLDAGASVEDQLAALAKLQTTPAEPVVADAKADEEVVEPDASDPLTEVADKVAIEELKVAASAGTEALAILRKREDEDTVAAAMSAGKFGPASRDGWLNRLHTDREGAKADMATLASGLVPVAEIGTAAAADQQSDSAHLDAVMASFGHTSKGA